MMSGCGSWAGKVGVKPGVFESIEDVKFLNFKDKRGDMKWAHARMSKVMAG
jgi:hypothetical protein